MARVLTWRHVTFNNLLVHTFGGERAYTLAIITMAKAVAEGSSSVSFTLRRR